MVMEVTVVGTAEIVANGVTVVGIAAETAGEVDAAGDLGAEGATGIVPDKAEGGICRRRSMRRHKAGGIAAVTTIGVRVIADKTVAPVDHHRAAVKMTLSCRVSR